MERPKMTRENRAKQFMPFAALKGYPEALRKMEKIIIPKAELSEERADELDRSLRMLEVGMMAEVVFYDGAEYVKTTGMVSKVDVDSRFIRIVNTKIAFADLYQIEIIKKNI